MKRLLVVLTSSSLLLAACAPTVKDERKRNPFKTTGQDQNASPGDELTPADETTPPASPVEDASPLTPVNDPVEKPAEKPAEPAKPTPPPTWNNGVSGTIGKALDAALTGKGLDLTHPVYNYKWKMARASITRNGDTVTIEGTFRRSSWLIDDKISYEFVYVGGKLERNDIFVKDSQNPLVILGPIASIVGAYYGIPIPPDAISKVVLQIESIAVGSWQDAAQKLAFRIGMDGYLLALSQSGNT